MERKKIALLIILIIVFIAVVSAFYLSEPKKTVYTTRNVISITTLPSPQLTGNISVEEAIQNRRSIRKFSNESISINNVSQILWAAQGITDNQSSLRAAPSAGQVYPLEIYLITGSEGVSGLDEGVYHYVPSNNTLEKIINGDLRADLSSIANGQPWVKQAPINILITGNYMKMINKYNDKELCTRFVDLEAGHVGENIYLQSETMGLVTVSLGSFNETQLIQLIQLPGNETPIYIFPVGHPQQ
jgi:SagB-type dehydrogenase family enzyme